MGELLLASQASFEGLGGHGHAPGQERGGNVGAPQGQPGLGLGPSQDAPGRRGPGARATPGLSSAREGTALLPRLPHLASPPRTLSRDLRIQVYLGGPKAQIGLALLGLGLALFLAVAPRTDVSSLWHFAGNVATAGGTVVATHRVPALQPGDRWPRALTLQEIRFSFQPASPEAPSVEATAWWIGGFRDPGDSVTVEHLLDRPEIARLHGTWRSPFPPWALLTVLLPIAGVWILVPAVREARLALRLMRQGAVTRGEFWARDDVPSPIGLPPLHHLEYRYTPEGAEEPLALQWSTHSPLVLSDGPETPVIYDPEAPAEARLLVTLPGPFRLDEDGHFQPLEPATSRRALVLPILSALLVLVAGVTAFL
ncbi:MAG: hypothetical protein JXB39_12270 [Deltaproteobacteria bacterium]|nr:hypothetical protein [Deltaproteobacteria bacterium]